MKKTETRVRIWQDGKLTSDTITTVVERPGPTTAVPIGFQLPAGDE